VLMLGLCFCPHSVFSDSLKVIPSTGAKFFSYTCHPQTAIFAAA